ncbi:MAG: DUF6132 family protein, partial [Phycisphaeraceae bacterium]
MLIKTLAGIGLFAAAGAAIGYSKILCAGGECAITGTPYGGAVFGGMLGLAVMSSFNSPAPAQPDQSQPPSNAATDDLDDRADAGARLAHLVEIGFPAFRRGRV